MTEEERETLEDKLEFHAEELERRSNEVRNLSTLLRKAINQGASVQVDAEKNTDTIRVYIRSQELTDTLKTISDMCSSREVVEYDYENDVFIIKDRYLLY